MLDDVSTSTATVFTPSATRRICKAGPAKMVNNSATAANWRPCTANRRATGHPLSRRANTTLKPTSSAAAIHQIQPNSPPNTNSPCA